MKLSTGGDKRKSCPRQRGLFEKGVLFSFANKIVYNLFMGTPIEMNALFRLPKDCNVGNLKEGSECQVTKSGSRFYPISMPVEFCDSDYKYLGKVIVSKLEITKDETIVYFKVIKIFSEEESRVFTANFIKP